MRSIPYPELIRNPKLCYSNRALLADVLAHKCFGRALASSASGDEFVDTLVAYTDSLFLQHKEGFGSATMAKKACNRFYEIFENLVESKQFTHKLTTLKWSVAAFESSGTVLRLNDSFYSALCRVEAKFDVLPFPSKTYYVSLQRPVALPGFPNHPDIIGAYMHFQELRGIKHISITTVDENGIGSSIGVPLVKATFKDSVMHLAGAGEFVTHNWSMESNQEVLSNPAEVLSGLVNACIYFESLEPDVRHLEPHRDPKARTAEAKAKGVHADEIPMFYPAKLLNWSYGKDRTYTKDSTWVDSHLRWQPCGAGRKEVKLILVKAHERHFSKTIPVS